MRKIPLGLLALTLVLAWSAPARATIVFDESAAGTGDNVLLNSGLTGTSVTGTVNSGTFNVVFSSTQTLSEPSSGQARIEAVGALLTNIHIQPQAPVGEVVFNMFFGSGTATVTVHTDEAVHIQTLGNGQNFLDIKALNGEVITSVDISAASGFTDLRQVRIDTTVTAAVPEPASLALLGLSGLELLGYNVRRRKQAA